MKGFKKDGKFRPTGNRKKSSLKKSDVLIDKFGRRSDDDKITKTTWKSDDGKTTYVKFDYFGKGDPKYDERARKGYKPKSFHFNSYGLPKSKSLLQKLKIRNKDTMADASSVFQNYVVKYPDSDIGRNAKNGYPNAGGDFSNALFDGDIEEAMYRADAHNLVKLHELGIESELSDVKRFEDMPSPRIEFEQRYDWAKEYVKHNRNKETLECHFCGNSKDPKKACERCGGA